MVSRKNKPTLARVLRPEDVRRGHYVAILYTIDEYLPLCPGPEPTSAVMKPTPLRWLPCDRPEPLKVLDVCLPFVLVKPPAGNAWMLDVRKAELARLDGDFARHGAERMKAKPRRQG